jgi:hypothetical protein
MKNLLFVALLTFVTLSLSKGLQAQPHFDMGAGYDLMNHHTIGTIAAGYTVNQVMIEGQMKPSITRAAPSNNYFGGRVGITFPMNNEVEGNYGATITPCIGYYYNLRSGDDKSLNYSAPGYSIKYCVPINVNGGLYADAMYIEKSVQLSVGFHVEF